ncbi:MAG: alkaline phosphatase family protein [Candidatus Dormibacteraeota bacterium]|nr:alkaline phosphatase family protein [Candidatus Dormibacteraeota bacterium]
MTLGPTFGRRSLARWLSAALLPASIAGFVSISSAAPAAAASGCHLSSANGAIKHVIEVQFDNVHLTRDNPSVPSDLEQMPNLSNFLKNNGMLSSNHHTPLISHTADDIVTTLTGLYPDRHGMPVSNSYRVFKADGSTSVGAGSFQYWTDLASPPTDTKPNLVTAGNKNTPAPWVPFTRAGCNFGGVSTANIELESAANVKTVFGAGSPEAIEAGANSAQATADFIGIAIHCAQGAAVCAGSSHAQTDALPDEPGGYTGFKALFGHKYVAPVIAPPGSDLRDASGNMTDLNHQTMINPDSGTPGFPGFSGISVAQSLAYVAAMQEHNVPITYAYISDAHGDHTGGGDGGALGPGEKTYEDQLKAYDQAFGTFFNRLAADGINKSNTLFVFTSDENDHYAGRAGTPAGCNGIAVLCHYDHSAATPTIGEIAGNLRGLLNAETGNTTPFQVHADMAPAIYLDTNPSRDAAVTRQFDHDLAALVDPQNRNTGQRTVITQRLADSVELKLLHMVTVDPQRTPTLVMFANADYFFFRGGPTCAPISAQTPTACLSQSSAFAWQHGGFQPEIVTTWLGMVGPGIKHLGRTNQIWSDHTDVRPTIMTLVGLKDDYAGDGRVMVEVINSRALPKSLRSHSETLRELGEVYKQINAPVGELGLSTLKQSTKALEGNDATYAHIENQLIALTSKRNAIASQMISMLNAAAFGGTAINEHQARQLIQQGEDLLDQGNDENNQQGD